MRKKYISKIVAGLLSFALAIAPFANVVYGNDSAVEDVVVGGEEVVDGIGGSLEIEDMFATRSSAMEFKDGDTYTISFQNKSTGLSLVDNFALAITGSVGQQWLDNVNTVLIIQANSVAYGGELSGIWHSSEEYSNRMIFEDDIDWDSYVTNMQQGVECEVTISRVGDIFVYDAEIGEYTVSATAVAANKLPEVCYLFLTGSYCELTNIQATYSDEPVEVEIVTTEDIPDETLYAELLNVSDINGDGIIQEIETKMLRYLDVYNPVLDYTGLELFENLKMITVAYSIEKETNEGCVEDLETERECMLSFAENCKKLNNLIELRIDVGELDEEIMSYFVDKNLERFEFDVDSLGDWLDSEELADAKFFETVNELYVNVDGEDVSLKAFEKFANVSILDVDAGINKIKDIDEVNDKTLDNLFLSGVFSGEELEKIDATDINHITLDESSDDEKKVQLDIGKFKDAEYITLYDFKVVGDIEDLSEDLKCLRLYSCELADTALDMSKYESIEDISITGAGLESITGLDKMTKLFSLQLEVNKLTEVPKLSDDIEWIASIDLSDNKITDISSLCENENINNSLQTLELDDNQLSSLPDMSVFKILNTLNLGGNLLESLKGANLDKLDGLYFEKYDNGYNNGLLLGNNKLDKEDIIGYVPAKFSGDIQWLSEAASVSFGETTYVTTFMDSEFIASELDSYLREYGETDYIVLFYNTICTEVVFEEELLDYIRELGISVEISFDYYNKTTGEYESSVCLEFDEIGADVTSYTLNIDVLDFELAEKEICDLLGNDIVYSGIKLQEDVIEDVDSVSGAEYNVYKISEAGVERVDVRVSVTDILKYIEEGEYPETGYYYVNAYTDTYYNYTDEEGVKSDPEKYEGVFTENSEIEKLIDKASEGDKITVANWGYIDISTGVWNKIIDKKLTLTVKEISNNGIYYVFTFAYDKICKIEEGQYVEFWLNVDEEKDGLTVWPGLNVYNVIETEDGCVTEYVFPKLEYTIPVAIYAGRYFANGTQMANQSEYYYILDKDMNKVLMHKFEEDRYTVKAGMIEFELANDKYYQISDINNKDIEENKPNFNPNATYEDGELVLDVNGQAIENVNIAAIQDGFTIITEFEFLGMSENSGWRTPIWSLDARGYDQVQIFAYESGLIEMDAGINEEYIYAEFGEVEVGTHELIINVYEKDEKVFFDGYLDGVKSFSTSEFDANWAEFYTFYSNDFCIWEDHYNMEYAVAKVKTNKVYAGVTVPEKIIEKEVIEVVDKLPEEFIVDMDHFETIGALVIESGDKYTFEFDYKYYEDYWGEFIFKVVTETGYEYDFNSWGKTVFAAHSEDYCEWGGILDLSKDSDIVEKDTGVETDEEWMEALEAFEKGTPVTVTIERDGNVFLYKAVSGDFVREITVTSGSELPEECYILLSGYSCEVTNFESSLESVGSGSGTTEPEKPTEPETEKPTEKPTEPETEKPTEKPTEPETEKPTEKPTEPETEKPTEKPTEPETQKPVVNTKEEGKNSAPETVKENKVVEPEKVVDTAVQKMETTILKTVEIVSPKPQTLTKEVFDTIQSEGKNLTVGVTNEDNQLQYSWTFSNKAMNNTDMNIDLTITFDEEKKEEISELTGREDALYISFAHHGELPGPATIKTYVGDKYKNGDVVYLYYFSEEEQKILMVGNKPLTVKGGYVEYTITHCSTYFLMEEKLEGIEKDKTSLDDASITLVEPEEDAPKLGDATHLVMWYAVLSLGVCMVMVANKKKQQMED